MAETKRITREQIFAQRAFEAVGKHRKEKEEEKYCSFALSFPALIHGCGLAQALSFAMSKKREDIVEDLAQVLGRPSGQKLAEESRSISLSDYLRSTREALDGAGWIKRYAATLLKGED